MIDQITVCEKIVIPQLLIKNLSKDIHKKQVIDNNLYETVMSRVNKLKAIMQNESQCDQRFISNKPSLGTLLTKTFNIVSIILKQISLRWSVRSAYKIKCDSWLTWKTTNTFWHIGNYFQLKNIEQLLNLHAWIFCHVRGDHKSAYN